MELETIKYGKFTTDRDAKAKEIVSKTGATLVHPFNDPDIIAGQGTCGLEIANQLEDFDSVIVPVGGGGLISGISTAIKALKPGAKVYGVEPQGAPKLQAANESREDRHIRLAIDVLSAGFECQNLRQPMESVRPRSISASRM